MNGGPVTEHLARRFAAARREDLPDDVAELARHCLLDWFGCALAGSGEPLAGIVADTVIDEGPGPARLLARPGTVPARAAALANGVAGHALDYDDTHMTMIGHPTAPVLPALLALADTSEVTGDRLVTALVVGIEIECHLGRLLNPAHYRAGWHATGTLGVIGAAGACAHVLGLAPDRFAHALALAATQSAGLKASFGTMAKPLHAGKAASDGLLSARLAAAGFEGNHAVVEAPGGLGASAGAGAIDGGALDHEPHRWFIRETLFKWHAACYLTHAAMNAATALRHRVDVDKIEQIEVHVSPDLLAVCAIPEPGTGLEAKFSVRATTAMALLGDDTAALAAYSDQRMADTDLIRIRDLVTVVPDARLARTASRVVVTTPDGEVTAEDDTSVAATDLGRQRDRLSAKFRALAEPVLGAEATGALHAAVTGVDELGSCRLLLDLARPSYP